MGEVFELNRRGVFSLASARQLLPLVFKITAEIDIEARRVMDLMMTAQKDDDSGRYRLLEAEAQVLIDRWEAKIRKLGLEPKGLWLVDIDFGQGYFCWKYPELDIKFWHGYSDGFTGRRPIEYGFPEALL